MNKLFVALFLSLTLFGGTQALACVGKVLYIGVSNSANDQLLAEMVSVLVSERTGTSVKVVTYKTSAEIYNAIKQGQVGLMIENTDHALEMMKKSRETSSKATLDLVKKEYRKTLNLVWLEPFGSPQANNGQIIAPVIATDVLGNLPALPKLINKLSGILNEGSYQKLLKTAKPDKKTAREFLKAKKYI